ncbi:MAG: hypothetical protein NZM11_09880 [Anaerolineales bacterium]|nr:hypothetical protein [Anaerolineales bacterium]
MGLSRRLGNFLILMGLLSLLIFAADLFASDQIEHFEPLIVAVIALWLGAKLRGRKEAGPPAAPSVPKSATPAPRPGLLGGLFKPKPKHLLPGQARPKK